MRTGPSLVEARKELRGGAKFRPTTFDAVRTGSLRRVAVNRVSASKDNALWAIEYCLIDINDEPTSRAIIRTVALDLLSLNLSARISAIVASMGNHHGRSQL